MEPIEIPALDSRSGVPWANSQGSGINMDSINM